MAKQTQVAMFPAGDDLPLFSGAAPRAVMPLPLNADVINQPRLFATCPICFGTGLVVVQHGKPARICWCRADD